MEMKKSIDAEAVYAGRILLDPVLKRKIPCFSLGNKTMYFVDLGIRCK